MITFIHGFEIRSGHDTDFILYQRNSLCRGCFLVGVASAERHIGICELVWVGRNYSGGVGIRKRGTQPERTV